MLLKREAINIFLKDMFQQRHNKIVARGNNSFGNGSGSGRPNETDPDPKHCNYIYHLINEDR